MAFVTYTDDVLVAGEENVHSFLAKEKVLQGQVVEADTDDAGLSVEPSDADGASALGVALYTAEAGEMVAVAMANAIVRAVSGTGSIEAGELVAAEGATGEEGEVAKATSGDYIIGIALKADTGTGTEGSLIMQIAYGAVGVVS